MTMLFEMPTLNKSNLIIRKMIMIISVYILALGLYQPGFTQQKPVYKGDDIIVTASRTPATFTDITRSIVVIGRDEIEVAPVHSVQDLLEYVSGVDVKQRGPLGVQADVSIRGGTFEQTLILVDGIKVSDPQTGHHNLNLPLTLDDIEKIEILKGQGSRLYGPNAFSGVINIITRKNEGKFTSLKVIAGDFGFIKGDVSISYPLGIAQNRLSISRGKSDGYRANTEFDIATIYYGSSIRAGLGNVDFSFGYTDKEFGANSFYSDNYPNEWEHITTVFLNSGAHLKKNNLSFSPKIYFRQNKDDFILDRERPEWFRNHHTTNVYGVELQSSVLSGFGSTAFGGEAGKEDIESSNLSNHSRLKGGLFFEHYCKPVDVLTLVLGASSYYYANWGWNLCPGIDLGYQYTEEIRFHTSVGQSFRVPTFTDLYYTSPANIGNQDLKPEESRSFETGVNLAKTDFSGELCFFHRRSNDLIDWVRIESTDPWEAMNISNLNTYGIEAGIKLYPDQFIPNIPVSCVMANYEFLDCDKDTKDFESKSVLNYFKHQFILQIYHRLPYGFAHNWKLRYENRIEQDSYLILDAKIFKEYNRVELYIEATNLLNTEYKELGSIPMPRRWVKAGINMSLMGKK